MSGASTGRLIGVGTGPGDPELLTLKAVKALEAADVLAYFAKEGRRGNGRAVVDGLLKPGLVELPLYYPVTVEIDKDHDDYKSQITGFYDASAAAVAEHLEAGKTVAILSEGDPMFYGSYMHLHVRLAGRFPVEVIPGITAMSGCWSLAGLPIVQGDDVLSGASGHDGRRPVDPAPRRYRSCRDHEGRPQSAENPAGPGCCRKDQTGRFTSSAARWRIPPSIPLAEKA